MSYYDLKTLHVFIVICFVGSVLVSLYQTESKFFKVFTGIMSLLTVVTGLIMMDRLNIDHNEKYPLWINVKFTLWLVIAVVTPLAVRRFKTRAPYLFFPYLILVLIATGMAIYKPY